MILTLSAISSGADIKGATGEAKGDSASAPFAGLFADVLSAQLTAKDPSLMASLGVAGRVVAEDGVAVDRSPGPNTVLASILSQEDASQTGSLPQGQYPASGMQLPVFAGSESVMAVPFLAALASGEEPQAVEGAELLGLFDAMGGKGNLTGKKLPDWAAFFAGRASPQGNQSMYPVQPEVEGDAALREAALFTDAGAGNSFLTALAKAEPGLSSPSAIDPNVSMQPSGHEMALVAQRSHAAALPEKLVLPMQNGFASPAWQQELGDKLVWLTGKQGQTAELVLNPPSLGTVEVRLNLSGGEASAQFFSGNPNVREAIEAALPRLREMMSGAGITLGEAMVSDQPMGRHEEGARGHAADRGGREATEDAGEGRMMAASLSGNALLDDFA